MTSEIKIEIENKIDGNGDPLDEFASAIVWVTPQGDIPPHSIRLDVWPDGEMHLSVWADSDHAFALWEGKVIPRPAYAEVVTRETTSTRVNAILTRPASTLTRDITVADLIAEARGERWDEAEAVVAARASRADNLALLPLAPPADPLAEFRDLEPGKPLYDRASGRYAGDFEGIDAGRLGETIRLRSTITGHTVWSSGRAFTRHARPIYQSATLPG